MPAAMVTATPVRRAASARSAATTSSPTASTWARASPPSMFMLYAPATATLDLAVSDCASAAEPDSARPWVPFSASILASPPIVIVMPAAFT